MRRLAAITLTAAAVASTTAVRCEPRPDRRLAAADACVLSDRAATYFDGLDAVPEIIRADLLAHTGPMAARDEPFNATDLITPSTAPLPSHRFLRAAHSGVRWLIWYEHGGYGDHVHLAVYVVDVTQSGQVPVAGLRVNLVGRPCAAAEAVLSGVSPASPRDW